MLCRCQLGLFVQSEVFRVRLFWCPGPRKFFEFIISRLQDVDKLEDFRLWQGRC